MSFSRWSLLAVHILGGLIGACAPSPGQPATKTITHTLPQGPIEDIYKQISAQALEDSSFFQYGCDSEFEKTKLELGNFVDTTKPVLLKAIYENPTPENPTTSGPLPSSSVRSDSSESVPQKPERREIGGVQIVPRMLGTTNEIEWRKREIHSWALMQMMKELIEKAIQEKDFVSAWSTLNELDYTLRALSNEELRRRVYKANYTLNQDTIESFRDLRAQMKLCLVNENCDPGVWEKSLSDKTRAVMAGSLVYVKLTEWTMLGALTPLERRERLERFLSFVETDLDFVSARKTSAIKRLGPSNYQVFLEAGHFAGVEADVVDFVSELWSQNGRQLSIVWAEGKASLENLLPFRFELLATHGRGFVSYEERKIVLPKVIQYGTLHHELGHVSGLPDSYYMTFDEEKCTYTQHSLANDIMSNSVSGTVLEAHWKELEKLYN